MIVTAEIVILDITDKPELASSLVECVMKCDYGRTKPQGQAARVFCCFFVCLFFYNIVLVLPYINMHPPRVYTCSPS